MMRLVRRGLMFGNLFEVRQPALVERYNRALEHLTGKRTELTDFHLDISGHSPEIGDELADELYLNPNGCNRQFILLSTDQKTAPLLNAQFSTSRSILRRWIDENEQQLFALTARDAVAGELINSVFSVADPRDLLSIREIEIEADTTESHVEDSRELREKIDRFMTEEDAWWDDVLTAEMIELGKKTGDITRNPVVFTNNRYTQNNFYTAHHGGLYVFRDLEETAVISARETPQWVVVTHYGWRNEFLTIYPNAVAVREVAGPDVRVIPWVNIVIYVLLALLLLGFYRLVQRFKRRRIDPLVEKVEEKWDAVEAKASEAGESAEAARGGMRRFFKGWFG